MGGPLLGEEYVFWQIHMHWGSSNNWGAEHRLDGHAFPAELHIVHYKARAQYCIVCYAYPFRIEVLRVEYFFRVQSFQLFIIKYS